MFFDMDDYYDFLNQDLAAERALWHRIDIIAEEFTYFYGLDFGFLKGQR